MGKIALLRVLGVSALVFVWSLFLVACAGQAPAPAPAPPTPTAAPAPKTSTAPPAPKAATAPSTPQAAKPAQTEGDKWKAEYDAEMKKLADDAKKAAGGKVVVLFGASIPDQEAESTKYFKEKWGVDIVFVTGSATQNMAKMEAELAAGKITQDYFESGPAAHYPFSLRADYFLDYAPPAAKEPGVKWVADPLAPGKEPALAKLGNAIIYKDSSIYGAGINTNLVPADRVPKNWDDLLDPWWKGKMIFYDPRVTGSGNSWYTKMYQTKGEEYVRKYFSNGVTLVRDIPVGSRQLATGEFAMFYGASAKWLASFTGAPIRFIDPGAMLLNIGTGSIIKGGPNTAAAKLYQNFLVSKDGQEIQMKYGDKPPLRLDVKPNSDLNDLSKWNVLKPFSYEDETVTKAKMREHASKLLAELGFK
ncbi:MAG: extracellular solute-binding protein [Chloroflexi bacterium]|nr:extracellular solute-binding protein [Chloroflexota bacterium]